MAITKAVIPVAGLGTRFLPVTKTSPKEMLPIVDKPAIEYVVEEASRAGLDDILLVTGRTKRAIEDYFDVSPELEQVLRRKGDDEKLASVLSPVDLATIHFVRQGRPRGLGHAVLCARQHVGDEHFAVLLGDDLIDERDPVLPAMLEVAQRTGGSVVALLEVPQDQIQLYGCAEAVPTDPDFSAGLEVGGEALSSADVVQINGLVEKPSPEDAPSNLAVIGRYVLSPAVFDVLEETEPGRGGEIQLTDALAELAKSPDKPGHGVYGVVFRGRRYDTGDKLDYLKAVVQLAADRDDLGADFREWLHGFTAGLQ
ncbi:UTP--glucose-1-phosphate uridylyltransferase GalU [Rarobacter faecitabidus]|uniref:UTP--glucose-1-phosphate uridylyltransferase n=1 Tax=Rarobacter faecitabidus TaxID=13243 RepID=A0A542ZTQ2_RARFA|nr:UTP--glucose-1-phosphate uridylyltransferase GalU [Rarobacter faecitabidus]TQL63733.1 UDP-glucose pyrophosphorylase [Rarobacter faecitabidus]